MGWAAPVGIIQNILRRFVYRSCLVDLSLEVRGDKPFPVGDAVITCMDGFEKISKVFCEAECARVEKDAKMHAFSDLAAKLGLPLNVSKQVICSVDAAILGSELNGKTGLLRHRRDKSMNLFGRTLARLSLDEVGQAPIQHWCGLLCFAAGFRRPLFSVLQDVFLCIADFEDSKFQVISLLSSVRDEFLLAAILLPFAGVNLRDPLRRSVSISDASEQGGGVAEATNIVAEFAPEKTVELQDYYSQLNEEATEFASRKPSIMCVICALRFEIIFPKWCVCGPGCLARACSSAVFYKHKAQRCKVAPGAHPQVGLLELGPKCGIAEAILSSGVQVVPLGIGETVVQPLMILVNSCPSLSSVTSKAKYGQAPGKHRAEGRFELKRLQNMFVELSKWVQAGKNYLVASALQYFMEFANMS